MKYKRWLKTVLRVLPDSVYLRLRYYLVFRRPLHLNSPKTYNEKVQWLNLYDRNPEYTRMVDKYEAKKYVAERIGKEYIIPTLGVWDRFDEIDFDALPDRFVLKCTHDSGGLVICRDKASLDMSAAREIIESSLKNNYYWDYREWPYKHVRPRIIAEPYLQDEKTHELRDYKLYTFGGKVKALLIVSGRETGSARADYFDADFHHLDLKWGYPNADTPPSLPEALSRMKELAGLLGRNMPFLRVDFYEVNGHVFFGELTLYDGAGLEKIEPEEWDEIFGNWIVLPENAAPRGKRISDRMR